MHGKKDPPSDGWGNDRTEGKEKERTFFPCKKVSLGPSDKKKKASMEKQGESDPFFGRKEE